MAGLIQWVAYLIAVYMAYRGLTDALRDFSEMPGRTWRAIIPRAIAAVLALLLLPLTFWMMLLMDEFARQLAVR